MSDTVSTPPPKVRKHQYSKSATPVSTVEAGPAGPKSSQRRNRGQRNQYDNSQGSTHQQLVSTMTTNGYNNESNTDGEMVYDQFASSVKSRKPRRNQQRQQMPNGYAPQLPTEWTDADGQWESNSPPKTHLQASALPPFQASNKTPAKSTAYAGSAFQSSPAPSALPMPKFFSKSMPSGATQPTLQSRLDAEPEKTPTPSPPSVEATPAVPNPLPHLDSPLDIFFKADREEKARRSSALLSPSQKRDHPPPDRPNHSRHLSNGSGKGLFMMELDGHAVRDSDRTPPPAKRHPIPKPEGMATARSVTAPSAVPQSSTTPNPDRDAVTKSLKDLIFSLPPQPTQPWTTPGPEDRGPHLQTPSPFYRPESEHRSRSGPTTPQPQGHGSSSTSLYYGNRNLSPLFKAASQPESVKRASSLRQEVPASSPTADRGQYAPAQPTLASSIRYQSNKIDPNSFSRNFLQQHIHGTESMPNLPLHQQNGQARSTSGVWTPASSVPPPQSRIASKPHNVVNAAPPSRVPFPPSQTSVSSGHSDVKTMENDLRRLLNLNVAGGNTTPGVR